MSKYFLIAFLLLYNVKTTVFICLVEKNMETTRYSPGITPVSLNSPKNHGITPFLRIRPLVIAFSTE